MPMLDVYVPEGALDPDVEDELLRRITDVLITHEGFDPADPATRAASWAFLHRPAAIRVGGEPADAPRYKIVPSYPEGQLDADGRAAVVAAVTEAVLDAERGHWPRDPARVWVFPTEIPEGHWGGRGGVIPLAAILSFTGDPATAEALAAERIARARAERA
ncbi:Tautomerase enzyme [Actinomadura rayongensis]|uniref:Tautomerase enzyme n=1 Tax=Actinomadura rayongensis TaxID=1429076 RepID=A0A6I4W5Z4_9ACTN|nr:Tautomerase enzyme [Actinomadura rayongensis]MXQ64180.1 Tautomerase enzyme [Actinomadura rayongensis]